MHSEGPEPKQTPGVPVADPVDESPPTEKDQAEEGRETPRVTEKDYGHTGQPRPEEESPVRDPSGDLTPDRH